MTARKFKIDNAVALVFSVHSWGNRKKADKEEMTTEADKAMLHLTKQLIDSIEYKAIRTFLGMVKAWVIRRSVPSFFKDGIYYFSANADVVREVEEYLAVKALELKPFIEEMIVTYPQRIEDAEKRLKRGRQFKRSDYPTAEYLRRAFYFESEWIFFDVPKSLPEDVYQTAVAKKMKGLDEMAESIAMCLREAFRGLIAHARERLTPGPGGKKKIIRDSVLENVNDFIDTFSSRNLVGDMDLANLVQKAQAVLRDVDSADVLRDDKDMAKYVQKQFKEIETSLDGMIVERPRRKFDFSE